MWKALIKLVEKLAYRCDHKWELVETKNILNKEYFDKCKNIIDYTERIYVCSKCCKSQKIR